MVFSGYCFNYVCERIGGLMSEMELLQGIYDAINLLVGLRIIEIGLSSLRSIRRVIIRGY